MSTERLSAKDFLGLYLMDHPYPDDPAVIQAAEAYAKQEVEQQTKQLREEREALKLVLQRLLFYLEKGTTPRPGTLIYEDAKKVINQLNQQNEG